MKTAFLLGGFNLKNTAATYPGFDPLKDGLKLDGYNVVAVDIGWKRKIPTQYAKEFVKIYNKHKTEENIIIGNSFGAVVAFMTAPELKPNKLYLCSLSPFFKEDKGVLPDSYGVRYFGHRRMEDLWSISAKELATKIVDIDTYVVYGELEHESSPALVSRCTQTARDISGAKLVEIDGAPHDMTNSVYTNGVLALIISN